jgi:hypothetical protein
MADDNDERKKRWKMGADRRLVANHRKSFEVAVGAKKVCVVRLDHEDAHGKTDSLQLTVDPSDAHRLARQLGITADYVTDTDPRPKELQETINSLTAAAPYLPVGQCIYCKALRHSDARRNLGEEHIIPLALNGDLVLPAAACGKSPRSFLNVDDGQ